MSKAKEQIRRIQEQDVGATGKRILLLEGPDDVAAIGHLLSRQFAGWERSWGLVAAGNKKLAIEMATLMPDWLALVDRDEWSEAELAANQNALPNLLVLPRFCLESYLSNPDELWLALPTSQQQKIDGGVDSFRQAILDDLENWRRHAAIWQVINPLWSGLRARGFKEVLLNPAPVANDDEIRAKLQDWSDFIDASRIWADVIAAITHMQQIPLPDFLHQHLYAKKFFPLVVVPALNRLTVQQSEARHRNNLFEELPLPADLKPVWQAMGLLTPENAGKKESKP